MNFDNINNLALTNLLKSDSTEEVFIARTKIKKEHKELVLDFNTIDKTLLQKYIDINIHNKDYIAKVKYNHRNIRKSLRKNKIAIMPETEVVMAMMEEVQYKNQQTYRDYTVTSLIQNSNLLYTEHSLHTEDKNTVLTYNYKKKFFSHYEEGNRIFNTLWVEEFKGRYMVNGVGVSSSYSKRIEPKETIYVDINKLTTIFNELIQGKMNIEAYNSLYEEALIKKMIEKRLGLSIPNLSINELNNRHTTEEKSTIETESKTFKKKAFKTFTTDIMKNIDSGIEYFTEAIEEREFHKAYYRSKLAELKSLKKQLRFNPLKGTYTLVYEASISKSNGRIYTPLNRLSKAIRGSLFGSGAEVDIDNMAFTYYLNEYCSKVKSEFKSLKHYTSSNANKQLVRRDVAKKLNVTQNEVKSIILSVLFGSTDQRAFKDDVFLKNLVQEVKSIRDFIKERDSISFNEAKTAMANEFMIKETLIMNTLLKKLNLKRADVIDIHDGLIIPRNALNAKTVELIKEVEVQFGYTFSGKTKIKSILKEISTENEYFKIKSLLAEDKTLFSALVNREYTEFQVDLVSRLLAEGNITKDIILKSNYLDLVKSGCGVFAVDLDTLIYKEKEILSWGNNKGHITIVTNTSNESDELNESSFCENPFLLEFSSRTEIRTE